jgi:hypothetical protein
MQQISHFGDHGLPDNHQERSEKKRLGSKRFQFAVDFLMHISDLRAG